MAPVEFFPKSWLPCWRDGIFFSIDPFKQLVLLRDVLATPTATGSFQRHAHAARRPLEIDAAVVDEFVVAVPAVSLAHLVTECSGRLGNGWSRESIPRLAFHTTSRLRLRIPRSSPDTTRIDQAPDSSARERRRATSTSVIRSGSICAHRTRILWHGYRSLRSLPRRPWDIR